MSGRGCLSCSGAPFPSPTSRWSRARSTTTRLSHPTTALLVVEVSDSSLKQDRLSKGAIYAAAGIPEYWIVNLRDEVVEVMRDPDLAQARYRAVRSAARGERLELVALPGAALDAAELLPRALHTG